MGFDLILPYFVTEGRNKKGIIKSMPGIYRFSVDKLIEDVKEAKSLGIKSILLFGVSKEKDEEATLAYSQEGIVHKAIRAIKKEIKDITVITDVCLCGYTSHGHCGILKRKNKVIFDKDKTREILSRIALSHAQAGADYVAPSAMMDGQVRAIRNALDKNGFKNVNLVREIPLTPRGFSNGVKILAYSAKYASNFYGPFREALNSRPRFADRSSYQLDFRNLDEALKEIEQDIKEGADIVMVKPALAYLDIIYRAKQKFNIPIAAYNVSGEYSLVKYAVKRGLADEKKLVLEILTSIKRAGADLIITYHAKELIKWLKQ